MKNAYYLPLLLFLTSCGHHQTDDQQKPITSMQTIDRNGFSETISAKDRLSSYQNINFQDPQPYKKVLRVYGGKGGKSESIITSYHPNGYLWQELYVKNGRAHGAYREFFENGQLKIESTVIEGIADLGESALASWIFDGTSRVYDEKGNLIASIPYIKGALEGISTYYHPNGAVQKTVPYLKNGMNGTVEEFDSSGVCISKYQYVNDLLDGESIGGKNGSLYKEEWKNGRLLNGSYFDQEGKTLASVENENGVQIVYENGIPIKRANIVNGEISGVIESIDQHGHVILSYTIEKGEKTGEEWEYFPSNNKSTQRSPKLFLYWQNNTIKESKTWFPSGQIESQSEWLENQKHGNCLAWYIDGSLMFSEIYEKGKLIEGTYFKKGSKTPISEIKEGEGVATLFTENGRFLRKTNYEHGIPILN